MIRLIGFFLCGWLLTPSAQAQPCLPTVLVKATGTAIPVEEALTRKQRIQGLMNRDQLKARTGMWFVFEDDAKRSFWMRNTRIPLDIVYVDHKGKIVRIFKNTRPYSERGLPSGAPARYVLEVNAGEASQLGLAEGGYVQTCGTPGPNNG
jgi:uncharacterized membrane protein (UPF0127 family)